MNKICDTEIVMPLCLIYKKCLETGKFHEIWKKANIIPIHKKESRQIKKNYRPFYLYVGKFSKSLFLNASMNISQITR